MKALNVGDVIHSISYRETGLKLGREFTVEVVGTDERGPGNHYYGLEGGFGADHLWLEKGYIAVVYRAEQKVDV